MLRKMLKLTVVLLVLSAFFVVPADILFGNEKFTDKKCTPLALKDPSGIKCSKKSTNAACGKDLYKVELKSEGKCDIAAVGYTCTLFKIDVLLGTQSCSWKVTGNPKDGVKKCQVVTPLKKVKKKDCSHTSHAK